MMMILFSNFLSRMYVLSIWTASGDGGCLIISFRTTKITRKRVERKGPVFSIKIVVKRNRKIIGKKMISTVKDKSKPSKNKFSGFRRKTIF